MRSYRTSNRAPLSGILGLLIAALVAGVVFGGILFAVEYFTSFYLVFAFPLFAGVLAGAALAWAVRAGKIRSPLLAILFGLLAGIVILAVYHAATYYIGFRGDVRETLAQQGEKDISDADLDAFLDTNLERDYGAGGILGYLRLAADEGFSITRATSSSGTGIDLQGDAVWIYWGVELLIAMVSAAGVARRAAVEPFDESSGEWYESAQFIGRASHKARKDLLNALKDGRYADAGRMLTLAKIKYPAVEVAIRRSPDRSSQDIYTIISHAQRPGRANPIKTGILSLSEFDMLNKAISPGDPMMR